MKAISNSEELCAWLAYLPFFMIQRQRVFDDAEHLWQLNLSDLPTYNCLNIPLDLDATSPRLARGIEKSSHV